MSTQNNVSTGARTSPPYYKNLTGPGGTSGLVYPIGPCHMAILNLKLVNCTKCVFVVDFDRYGIRARLIMAYPFEERNTTELFSVVATYTNYSQTIESMNIPTLDTEKNKGRLEDYTQNIILRYDFPCYIPTQKQSRIYILWKSIPSLLILNNYTYFCFKGHAQQIRGEIKQM